MISKSEINYLGQLVPALNSQGYTTNQINEIKQCILEQGGISNRPVEVYVSSQNALKIQAAVLGVDAWLNKLFCCEKKWKLMEKGYEVSSEVDEQPHDDITLKGSMNRLKNMKNALSRKGITNTKSDGVLRVLISLENGLMCEKIPFIKNPGIFEICDNTVWVDRCVETCEVWFQGNQWQATSISEGVTTPKYAVLTSKANDWTMTAGLFIAEQYGCSASDWHNTIVGKGRKIIMEELIKNCFGLSCALSNK